MNNGTAFLAIFQIRAQENIMALKIADNSAINALSEGPSMAKFDTIIALRSTFFGI